MKENNKSNRLAYRLVIFWICLNIMNPDTTVAKQINTKYQMCCIELSFK